MVTHDTNHYWNNEPQPRPAVGTVCKDCGHKFGGKPTRCIQCGSQNTTYQRV